MFGTLCRVLMAIATACAVATPLSALDPARPLSYARAQFWGLREGGPVNVNALAQSQDGYLWIAGQQGLSRFDGVLFERLPSWWGQKKSVEINSLLASRSGDLWLGHDWGGVTAVRNGKVVDAGYRHPTGSVNAIAENGQGDIWVSTLGSRSRIWHRTASGWQSPITIGGSSIPWITGMAVDSRGAVWFALEQDALHVIPPGSRLVQRTRVKVGQYARIAKDRRGRMWVADSLGLHRLADLNGRTVDVLDAKAIHQPADGEIGQLFFDKNNVAWIAAQGGVTRVPLNQAGQPLTVQRHLPKGGLTQFATGPVMEDKETGVWLGAAGGLERFSDTAIVQDTVLPSTRMGLVARQAAGGDLFVASSSDLYRLQEGRWRRVASLPRRPTVMCQDREGGLYFGARAPLMRLYKGKLTPIAVPSVDAARFMVDCTVDAHGDLLVTVFTHGLYRSADEGRTWSHDPATERRSFFSAAHDIGQDQIIYAPFGNLEIFANDRWRVLLKADRNPLGLIRAIVRHETAIYLCGDFGLGRLMGGRLSTLSASRFPILKQTSDMIRTRDGSTWVLSQAGAIRFDTLSLEQAFDNPPATLRATLLDWRDGLPGPPDLSRTESDFLAEAPDHRILVLASGRVSWIDPSQIGMSEPPPAALIRSVSVDGHSLASGGPATLPAGASRVQIGFTAPGFADPSGVRFRYRLEGFDRSWISAGNDRGAAYTNLAPGRYVFQVSAAHRNGDFSNTATEYAFILPPTFVQSNMFRILCLAAAVGALWLTYALRVRAVASGIRGRLEERVFERERIARELHDTLLQGFQGLMLRFQAVAQRFPASQPARRLLDEALDRAETVLVEGRDRVHDLRRSEGQLPIDAELRSIAKRVFSGEAPPKVSVSTSGRSRHLHVAAQFEVAAIGEEALRNACLHARAFRVSVHVAYDRSVLKVIIMDDGIGLPLEVRTSGRAGHFGIIGMRERAEKIGGTLRIHNTDQGGTEVTLNVPARTAYAATHRPLVPNFLRLLWARRTK